MSHVKDLMEVISKHVLAGKRDELIVSEDALDALFFRETINKLAEMCHANSAAAGWWLDPLTGYSLIPHTYASVSNDDMNGDKGLIEAWFPFVIAAKIALIHSEASEALEGHRKSLQDDKLPQFKMITVELADVVIRVLDLAGMLMAYENEDFGAAFVKKISFNKNRPDHALENRKKAGGKLY